MELAGKSALVTGGGGGIGAGIAEAFVEKGMKVVITDIDADHAASEAERLGGNVTGVYNGILTFVPEMKARRTGHIVNTSSMNGLVPHATFAAYTASKFAVAGMSEALRAELDPFGVGVSILYPGLTRSRMSEGQQPDLVEKTAEMIRSRMMEPVWLGRAVARAVECNELHIITHPGYGDQIRTRVDAILSAHGKPAQPGYVGGSVPTRLIDD